MNDLLLRTITLRYKTNITKIKQHKLKMVAIEAEKKI